MKTLLTPEILAKKRPEPKGTCWASITLGIALHLFILAASSGSCWAHARLVPEIQFEQPDGTIIELRGYGNEYRAVYETLDGYTVIFVPESRAYFYAMLSESGDELISSGIQVGQGDPQTAGLDTHVRIDPETARSQARRAQLEWEEKFGLRERWNKLKAQQREPVQLQAQRIRPTIGTKVGLTLLIDFDGTPGQTARSNLVEFLNGDNYRAFGNRGSVKSYFHEVSGGKLLYTNLVYGYIRIPANVRPRSYYDDVNRLTSQPAYEMIQDAIRIWTNQPNFMEEIVPQLEALSIDENGTALAANIFVAGVTAAFGPREYGRTSPLSQQWDHRWNCGPGALRSTATRHRCSIPERILASAYSVMKPGI